MERTNVYIGATLPIAVARGDRSATGLRDDMVLTKSRPMLTYA